jgi:hypothetical protein
MATEHRRQESTESQAGKTPVLPRVAALPGADRRILRKRLEWPLYAVRKQLRIVRRGSR